jgi:endonuclease/exonuclease/phosphatase family metal-dependent hydrolase
MRAVRRLRIVALVVAALAATLAGAAGVRADDGTTVTVMTRNLYFGADLSPVIAAPNQLAFVSAVARAYNTGLASDWSARAMRWAKEIAAAKPDLVGLQEAVEWKTQFPADFSPKPNATTLVANFVDLLVDDLSALGVPYTAYAPDTGYDVEAPGAFPFGFMDVRLTQHDVILARQESRLKVFNPQAGQYKAQITIPTVGGPIALPWAWSSVDARIGDHVFRFATTHLDSNDAAAQVAQAGEFIAGPGATGLPIVWGGDFNSDAHATTFDGPPPKTQTYSNIVAAGFTDAWAAANPGDPGYTCCQAADLRNAQSTLDERIDHIFTRGPWTAVKASLVGATADGKTAGGLWPSDHAGVVAKLNLQGRS